MKGISPRSHWLALSVLMTGSALSSTAYAQQTKPADTPIGLEEIVVTAQRVTETAQKAAITISVVQPEALAAVTQAQQLTTLAPALQIGNSGGSAPLIYVRGVGSFSSNPYTDSAVALNYDGIYLGRPTSANGLFYDLERLEVLKGPQGTLYGRNATGGALNVLPAKPKLGSTQYNAMISYGNYDAVNAQGAVNLPLSENVALRLSGIGYKHDGYNTDGTYSEKGLGGRAQLLFVPTDKTSIRLAADYFDLGGTGVTSTILGILDSATGSLSKAPFGLDTGLYDPRAAAILNSTFVGPAGATYGTLPKRPYADNQYYGVNADFSTDLGFAQLTVTPAWRRADIDESTVGTSFRLTDAETDKQASLEARLNGTLGSLDWLAGAFYFDEEVSANYRINANIQGGTQKLKADNTSLAGFARLNYHVSDNFRLTAAGRYTKDKKNFDGVSQSILAICTLATHACPAIKRLPSTFTDIADAMSQIGYVQPPGAPFYVDPTGTTGVIYTVTPITVDQSTKTNKFTYRLGAEYDLASQSLLYATVETGYRAGGFSFSSVSPTYRPETITAWTLGSKNRFFDSRLQVNVEGFFWKYKDQQLSHTGVGVGGTTEFPTENIGRSTNKGFEVEVTARPLRDTILHADLQYLNAKYDAFTYTEPDNSTLAGLPAGTVKPTTTCASSYSVTRGVHIIDCSGQRAQRSPKWTLNIGGAQTWRVGDTLKVVADVSTHYQTSSIVMFERLPFGVEGSYWTSRASLSVGDADDRWTLTGFIDNLEDKRVSGNTFLFPLGNIVTATMSPPRTYGIRLGLKM